MQQTLQETLHAWLDATTTLSIDIAWMHHLPDTYTQTPTPSTVFALEGPLSHLAHLWQVTKELEAFPLVTCWEQITLQLDFQKYCTVLVVILAVGAEAWHFLQTGADEDDEHADDSSIGTT